ncbi:MAG: hypothetical protein ACRDN9_19450, partial [Streptosporangiaceae bacterium]
LLVGAITYSVMGEEIDFSPALTAVTLGGPAAICLIAVGIGRLIPSAVASARWVSTGALLVFVTITGFSVGPFFAPAAILLLASSVVQTAAAPRRGT